MRNIPGNRKFEKRMAKELNRAMIAEDENASYYNMSEQEVFRSLRQTAGMELERMKQILR